MTWKEFKDAVEAEGVKDEDKIDFIDWSGWAEGISVQPGGASAGGALRLRS